MTESQLLLLNNLIYREELTKENSFRDKKIRDLLQELRDNNKIPQQEMSCAEWNEIFDCISKDDEILDLTLVSTNYESDTGARMACFVDPSGHATAVFAGTGANEWRDDCVAGTMADSPQQKKALEWFESLPYDNITVTGHSKGGNKAMYVAIVSDKAGECYAFDGEGFSNEFCEKYAEKILRKRDSIHLRANSRDFVNILLNYVAGDIKFIHNEAGISNAKEYHCPNALFEYKDGHITGRIGTLTDYQDPTMEMFHNFSVYLLNNATEAEKALALNVLGELLTQYLGGKDGIVRTDILEQFGVEGIEVVIRYLTQYLKDLKTHDFITYLKYRQSFTVFVNDIPDGFLSFILNYVAITSLGVISAGALFELIESGAVERIYQTAEFFSGGNVRGRDFSAATKEKMLRAAKETEEEPWWRVDRWDCWYRIEKFFGGMQWDQYTGRVDEYYRKLIDINDSSVKDIERIFAKVYELDSTFSGKIKAISADLMNQVLTNVNTLADSVYPKVTIHDDYRIPQQAYLPVTPHKTNEQGHRGPDAYEEVYKSFDVRNNPRYTPRYGDTWCNIYVWDVTTAMGCEIPHYYNRVTGEPMTREEALRNPGSYYEMSAPRMTTWLTDHGAQYGWIECDEATAIAMANKGCPTVAAGTNTGHVAMVVPQRDGDSGVMISQAGASNFEYGRLQNGFGKHEVKYFYHA